VLDTHELTALAGANCDREALLRAMVTDPIVNSISDARKIMDELLEKERPNLDPGWYK
jgi:alpha-galactosidase